MKKAKQILYLWIKCFVLVFILRMTFAAAVYIPLIILGISLNLGFFQEERIPIWFDILFFCLIYKPALFFNGFLYFPSKFLSSPLCKVSSGTYCSIVNQHEILRYGVEIFLIPVFYGLFLLTLFKALRYFITHIFKSTNCNGA